MNGKLPMAAEKRAGRWFAQNAAAAISIGPTVEEEAAVSAVVGDNTEMVLKSISY